MTEFEAICHNITFTTFVVAATMAIAGAAIAVAIVEVAAKAIKDIICSFIRSIKH